MVKDCSCDCASSTSSTISGSCSCSSKTLHGRLYTPTFVSAYSIAVKNGFVGTEEEWLASLQGEDGKSAYQIALDNGFVGTEEEWLASLVGPQGPQGPKGDPGESGPEFEELKEKVGEISETLDKYGPKLDPIFVAETTTGHTYNFVMTPEKYEQGDDVDQLDEPELLRLTAAEINAICQAG